MILRNTREITQNRKSDSKNQAAINFAASYNQHIS